MKRVILTDQFKQRLQPDLFDAFRNIELLTAYSNEDALRMHRSRPADLIITELYGAGMSTAELCSQLRGDSTRGVPVIVTCRDNEVERAESARCKAAAVLTLPLSRALLRTTLQQVLSIPPRRTLHGIFNICRTSGAASANIDCRMENISVTGMLIEVNADLHRGEKIDCMLALPAEQPFLLKAEVVRTSAELSPTGGTRYGVRFFRLNPTAQRAIERVVNLPLQANP